MVEPDTLDSEGYDREFWAHRIKLLDLALANALGPYRTLEELELKAAATASFGLGCQAAEVKRAVRWGILQLRAARARRTGLRHLEHGSGPEKTTPGGVVDAELARYALLPTLSKTPTKVPRKRKDPSVDTLVRTLSNLKLRDHNTHSRPPAR